MHPDARILAITVVLCLLTGLAFGLAPASQASKFSVAPALKGLYSESNFALGWFSMGKALVISQVALSMVLLIGAGLFVRTLRNLKSQDMGFNREHVLLIWTTPAQAGRDGPAIAQMFPAMQERLSSLPGVISASASVVGLLEGIYSGDGGGVNVQGYAPKADEHPVANFNMVASGFFETVGMQLVAGRDFTERDNETAPRVAVINQAMARYFFGDRNPVGKHLGFRRDVGYPVEIVGIVKDAKYNTLRDRNMKMFYIPYRQDMSHLFEMCIAVRTARNVPGLIARIRQELRTFDRNVPVLKIDSIEEQIDESLVRERIVATLSSLFGVLAIVLACLGLYGVVSYTATRRTQEIGIRLALGATRTGVRAMVLKETLLLAVAGIAIGVPAALAASRLIASRLFGVSTADPLTIATAGLLMIAMAALAGFVPAHRASKLDPMIALRYE